MESLARAVRAGDLNTVKSILVSKQLENNLDSYRLVKTALKLGHVDVFLELVSRNAPIFEYKATSGDDGNTLLHLAVTCQDKRPVQALLAYKLDLYAVNDFYETPMHVAAKSRSHRVLRVFLEYLVEEIRLQPRNIVDDDGLSVFHIVCMGRYTELVDRFLDRISISINDSVSSTSDFCPRYTALHFAVFFSRYDTVKTLVRRQGTNLKARTSVGFSAMHLACYMYDVEWMFWEAMPVDLTDLSREEVTVLFEHEVEKLWVSRYNVIELLVERDFGFDDRNRLGRTPLMVAVSSNYESCIAKESLLMADRVLEVFVRIQLKLIERIFSHYDSSVDSSDMFDGDIFSEESNGSVSAFVKAAVNACDDRGRTCLHIALTKGCNNDVVVFLLKFGADRNALDYRYSTPLHPGLWSKLQDTLRFTLLTYRSIRLDEMPKIDAQDHLGNTPFHYAYFAGDRVDDASFANFTACLDFGADVHVENEAGDTVFAMARDSVLAMMSSDLFSRVVSNFKETVVCANIDASVEAACVDTYKIDVRFVSSVWNHVKKLEICGGYSDASNDGFLVKVADKLHVTRESVELRTNFICSCEEEIEKMKEVQIARNLFLNDVICRNINEVASYPRYNHDALRSILESRELEARFPKYSKILRARYVRALERSKLLGDSFKALNNLIRLDVPRACLHRITMSLSEKKLRDIIKAGNRRAR